MAVIKIKRGGATANTAPSQLAAGEMAVTYGTSPSQSDNKAESDDQKSNRQKVEGVDESLDNILQELKDRGIGNTD